MNRVYTVQITPGRTFDVHASHMKPYLEDHLEGPHLDLFHYLPTHEEFGITPDEWTVDTILRHRKRPDGRLEFLTRWIGAGPGEETWEPVENFVLRYNSDWLQYCRDKNLSIDLTAYLMPEVVPE